MPDDFPTAAYEEMHRQVITRNSRVPIDSTVLSQFQSGWNAVAYRFKATGEHDQAFREALASAGGVGRPPMNNRYVQERELFGFFVTGLSVLEAVAYSVFALCSMVDAPAFPMLTPQDRRKVTPKETARQLGLTFPKERLSIIWQQLLHSPDFQEWRDIRNTLAHRSAPPRFFVQSASADSGDSAGSGFAATWKEFGIAIDRETTAERRKWLGLKTTEILKAANELGQRHL